MHGGSAGRRLTLAVVLAAGGLVGCGPRVEGSLEVDGSSTVFPITEAVAEEFVAETTGRFRVTVGLPARAAGSSGSARARFRSPTLRGRSRTRKRRNAPKPASRTRS